MNNNNQAPIRIRVRNRENWSYVPISIDSDDDDDSTIEEEEEEQEEVIVPIRPPTPYPVVSTIQRPVLDAIDELVECCICFLDKEAIFFDEESLEVSYLGDLDTSITTDKCIMANCNEHYHCVPCLRRIAIPTAHQESHPINREHSLINCQYPFDTNGCRSGILEMPNYFSNSDIAKILTEDEFRAYEAHSMRFSFPEYELIACPRCDVMNVIPNEKIDSTAKGHLVIHCIQNQECRFSFCYHCQRSCSTICFPCRLHHKHNDPESVNHFFLKELEPTIEPIVEPLFEDMFTDVSAWSQSILTFASIVSNRRASLYKNKELTIDLVVDNIRAICEAFTDYFSCPICRIILFKTEKCNGMAHCSVERCYSCGYISHPTDLLSDHWSERGQNGCPRFDTAPIWQTLTKGKFKCIEGICHSHDIGPCTMEGHQDGINLMEKLRQKAFIYHMILSLPDILREAILVHPLIQDLQQEGGILEDVDFSMALHDPERLRDYLSIKK